MAPNDLLVWLLSDGIKDDLRRISKDTVALEFEGLTEAQPDKSTVDWKRLLLAGSILARGSRRDMEESALRIATAAVLIGDEPAVRDTGAVLLEQLSNSRAVALAESRGMIVSDLNARLGVAARVEATRRALSQTVLEKFTGNWIPVNEFQEKFWSAASEVGGWLSASAPTASGKTFLVRHWLLDTMLTTDARVAVYIAPTRALVSEVESCLKELTHELGVDGSIEVASLPLTATYHAAISKKKKAIFVFTQERLHLLANALGTADVLVDLLVVDEAHKIGDSNRGVILQSAIERVSRSSQSLQAVFVSPATQNPGVLLEDAPPEIRRTAIDSDVPTVLQNVIIATQVSGAPTEWQMQLRLGDELVKLGRLTLQHRPTSIRKKIALIAAAAGSKGGTLVYANGAAEAETIAALISQMMPKAVADSDLTDLADLARKGVHPSYQLANVVERGVAFHYGNMPSLLRLEIERLFRNGKIKFLVCTSTLVEGVNLSCRTIVVRGPRKGKGKPMEAPDFWNLAGRAGRWGNEFQGNIICIDAKNPQAWPNGVPERTRYPIKRETDSILERSEELLQFIQNRADATPKDLSKSGELEQVSSYLLSTLLKDGSILHAPFAKRHDALVLSVLNESLETLASSIDLPADVVGRHPGVSAVGMQRLLSVFRNEAGREEIFLPEEPESEGAYDRLCFIMQTINQTLFPAFTPDARIPLYALIVIEWLKGYPLKVMIQKRLDYHKRHGHQVKLGDVIRGTMELVEQVARFRAPKFMSAYVDVLRHHLKEQGREEILKEEVNIAVALEFGVSTRTLLSLMEIGLSRMSAVAVNDLIANSDLNQEECRVWLRSHRSLLESSDIPLVILREIASLTSH